MQRYRAFWLILVVERACATATARPSTSGPCSAILSGRRGRNSLSDEPRVIRLYTDPELGPLEYVRIEADVAQHGTAIGLPAVPVVFTVLSGAGAFTAGEPRHDGDCGSAHLTATFETSLGSLRMTAQACHRAVRFGAQARGNDGVHS